MVFGKEPWFIDAVARATRNMFLGGSFEGYVSLSAPRSEGDRQGVSLAAAVDEVRTVPMFVTKKVVEYRARGIDEEGVSLLSDLAGRCPDFAKMVVLCPSLSRDAAQSLREGGVTVAESRRLFEKPYPGKPAWSAPLNQFTVRRARAYGKRLDARTALVLTDLLGNDLGAIDTALAKLALAAGERPDIEEHRIRSLVGGTREYDAFAFGEAIYNLDAKTAFRIQRAAFVEGMESAKGGHSRAPDFVGGRLLWSVQYQLKWVYAAALLLASGKSPEEAEKGLSRPPLIATRLVRQARSFRLPELRRHHSRIVAAEMDLRSGVPAGVVVAALVAELTTRPEGAARG